MKKIKCISFIALLLVASQSAALNSTVMNNNLDSKMHDNRSCNELYMQASILEKESFSYSVDSNNTTQVASIVSTVFTPAFYYLGYSAVQDFHKEVRSQAVFDEMETIRYRMAEKRCFLK